MTRNKLSQNRKRIVERAAKDIPDGCYINLGIGMPVEILGHLRDRDDVFVHTENGILGMRSLDEDETVDPDLVNASKLSISIKPGASYFHHADSFAIMRGGHLDYCVLGAYQVSATGDLANWSLGRSDVATAVGGAMDLVVGAKRVWVLMEHVTRTGEPRLVDKCSLPLTGAGVVDRIYTDRATIDITDSGLVVRELVGTTTLAELHDITPVDLIDGREGTP
ncbi:3-oxoadipate CoA-transferase [Rhodococcus sp. KBW08]|uniref:3-oxoacid CoA-transferase subunit B n=1 Tax=Rhodococcus sp. KBW08 TaxID=2144188 RepID=UPI000F5A3634|nr:3-oxoacid CoA-transferase subunit B [Rhodococcus sp. KBW08]RQO46031.1 3-oxoadipate CoA-transferase [Rhodococcus sp. KBW08]